MKTDIEIAQSAKMLPISEVAARAGIDGNLLEHYGRVKAKIDIGPLRDRPRRRGKDHHQRGPGGRAE